MAWHGYLALRFSGAFGLGGVKEADRGKIEKGCEALVTDEGKTKIMPQHALQTLWSLKGDEVIVEAQFKSEPDKLGVLLALVPEVGVALDVVMDFQVFGGGKNDWEASRGDCLAYIEAHADEWNRKAD
jgi:hypothetical protein